MGSPPTKKARAKLRPSLLSQVLAVNMLLVTAIVFVAALASALKPGLVQERWQFLALALSIILILLGNVLLLRRRFEPLERLIDSVERLDLSHPEQLPELAGPLADGNALTADVERLSASFESMLERLESERRRSGRLVLRAQEEERKRVALDLHDEVNQALTAILLRLQAATQEAPPGLRQELTEAKQLVNRAMEELLALARQLRPAALDDHGLVPALAATVREFEEHSGVQARFAASGPAEGLSDDLQLVAYRVTQEALSNVARHAAATAVEVSLVTGDARLELTVRDNGRGLGPGDEHSGLGLSGMRERARLVEGTLRIESQRHGGTTVRLQAPLSTAKEPRTAHAVA